MDRIDVFTVARTGAHWEGQLDLARMPRLAGSLLLEHGGDGAVAYRCHGYTDAQGRPGLRLWLNADLPMRCDRCAQPLRLALAAERDFYFVASGAELAAIPIDDAPEEALLGSAQFDLAALIEDEAILQLPLSPRHPDCAPARKPPTEPFAAGGPRSDGRRPDDEGRPHPFADLADLRDRLHQSSAKIEENGVPGTHQARTAGAAVAKVAAKAVPPRSAAGERVAPARRRKPPADAS